MISSYLIVLESTPVANKNESDQRYITDTSNQAGSGTQNVLEHPIGLNHSARNTQRFTVRTYVRTYV